MPELKSTLEPVKVLDFSGLERSIEEAIETIVELRAQRDHLLTVLSDAHEYLHGILSPCDEGCECILHPIEAAIAKAEGCS